MNEIDFSKLPVDTLVDVEEHGLKQLMYFKGVCLDGFGKLFYCSIQNEQIRTSNVVGTASFKAFNKIRISDKNPWLPWFGGECPVPPNCMVEYLMRGKAKPSREALAGDLRWEQLSNILDNCANDRSDIIAYRLLESPWKWQKIKGVIS